MTLDDCINNECIGVDGYWRHVLREELTKLRADAARFEVMRTIAAEADEATQNRMHDAFDRVSDEMQLPDAPTPEQFDAFFDRVAEAIVAVRT